MQQAAGPVAGERLRSAEVLRTKEEDERSSWWLTKEEDERSSWWPTSGRTGKAPGARWPRPPGCCAAARAAAALDELPPPRSGNYTNDEDELIICLHALLGNKRGLSSPASSRAAPTTRSRTTETGTSNASSSPASSTRRRTARSAETPFPSPRTLTPAAALPLHPASAPRCSGSRQVHRGGVLGRRRRPQHDLAMAFLVARLSARPQRRGGARRRRAR
ncbi:uncharacterized protein LOC120667260 [Panicum virgatum]|uniref:Uncharacterized protein n=1 Tax=Panicum virgatum TaxID=38727 RepID=A0A8T0W932_PANVG|nr:uncharacterized protein LOC120667260 [Panicum virgatum]KAG2641153.1 hypothetical protein PVAP13_2KG164616 [Panicum virgatum]